MAEGLRNEDRAGAYPYKNRTIPFSPGDIEILDWITTFLGCSSSDAIRSAVRAFATNLAQIDKRKS